MSTAARSVQDSSESSCLCCSWGRLSWRITRSPVEFDVSDEARSGNQTAARLIASTLRG